MEALKDGCLPCTTGPCNPASNGPDRGCVFSNPGSSDSTSNAGATPGDKEYADVFLFKNVVSKHEHKEIWGVTLQDPSKHVQSQIILVKVLIVSGFDIPEACRRLKDILDWRKEYQPFSMQFDPRIFDRFGLVTTWMDKWGFEHSIMWQTIDPFFVHTEDKRFPTHFLWFRLRLVEMAMHNILKVAKKGIQQGQLDPFRMTLVEDFMSAPMMKGCLRKNCPRQDAIDRAQQDFHHNVAYYYPEVWDEMIQINLPELACRKRQLDIVKMSEKWVKDFPPWRNRIPDQDVAALMRRRWYYRVELKELAELFPFAYGGCGPDLRDIAMPVDFWVDY